MKRTLSLRRETLAPLADGELLGIVGGEYSGGNGISCPVLACLGPSQPATCRGCVVPTQDC